MNWAILIPIIAQYGLPLAEKLFQKWSANATPTQADFDELRATAKQLAADRMRLNLVAAGVSLDSPRAQELITLAGGTV